MGRLQETLLEFGRGFSYVGRQVHFEVNGDDFHVALLLFHLEQLRYVVIELKIGRFKPEHLGQLRFYVAVVDDRLRRPDIHSPTVGILLSRQPQRQGRVVLPMTGGVLSVFGVDAASTVESPARAPLR